MKKFISCILLTAGASQRFGAPKALAQLNHQNVIEHLQSLLIQSNVDEIVIVLGAHESQIKPYLLKHKKIKVVYNKDYKIGQTSSFKCGVSDVNEKTDGIMLLPVDVPFIKMSTINHLVEHFTRLNPDILIPIYKGIKGHPPIFSSLMQQAFASFSAEQGLNTLIHQSDWHLEHVSVEDEGVISSFNTKEEYEVLKKRFCV